MTLSTGRVTVAQEVLHTIVRLATLSVPGVARLGSRPGLRRGGDGVRVEVTGDHVDVDVYVIVEPDVDMHEVGKTIQAEIARSMEEIVGMDVAAVNVHIQDVEATAGL